MRGRSQSPLDDLEPYFLEAADLEQSGSGWSRSEASCPECSDSEYVGSGILCVWRVGGWVAVCVQVDIVMLLILDEMRH